MVAAAMAGPMVAPTGPADPPPLAADRITGQAGRVAQVDLAVVARTVVEGAAEAAVPMAAAMAVDIAGKIGIESRGPAQPFKPFAPGSGATSADLACSFLSVGCPVTDSSHICYPSKLLTSCLLRLAIPLQRGY